MNVLILGAGEIGFHLAKRFSQEKYNITIIERDHKQVVRASEQLDAIVVEGHAASFRRLQEANIKNTDVLCAMTNIDEVNLIACQLAKKVGVPITIARVRKPEYTKSDFILSQKELGADLLIHPEKEIANAILRLIRQSSATDVMEFADGKVQLMGIRLEGDSPVLRTPLADLGKQMDHPPVRIVAINRKERTLIPHGGDVLAPGDQIFVICDPDYIPEYLKWIGKSDTRIENIMILGGGLIGQFISENIDRNIKVKIIESNADKSQELADRLPNALVIHGDGTDIDLLAVEGITDMDAFISVTGDDENNIISTLVARHLKVPRTIALVNKVEYLPITPTIGLDAVVSKQVMTVNSILRFIRYQQVAAVAMLPGVDAEIIECAAQPGSKVTKKPLSKVNFPKHAIIGAVLQNGNLVIPMGDTQINSGDQVVIFALPHVLSEVMKVFK